MLKDLNELAEGSGPLKPGTGLVTGVLALTLAFLCGLMLGSLNKVWPWKQTLEWQQGSDGKQIPLVQQNLLPQEFSQVSGLESQVLLALGMLLCGILLVWALERFASARRVATNEQ